MTDVRDLEKFYFKKKVGIHKAFTNYSLSPRCIVRS
jgi:hypothetical protein